MTKKWVDDIEKMSHGAITIKVHYGDLGSDAAIVHQLQESAVDGILVSDDTLASLDRKLSLFGFPFLFANYKQAYAVEDGAPGQAILASLKKYQMVGLGFCDDGFRNFAVDTGPISTPSALKGLKLRVQQGSAVSAATMSALGAVPDPMASGDVYTAVQQHVLSGLDMPVGFYLTAKLYEVVKYYTITRHSFTGLVSVFNEATWSRLSAAQQAVIKRATTAAMSWSRTYDRNLESSGLAQLKSLGVYISYPTDRQAFVAAEQPVYKKFGPTVGTGLLKKAQSIVAKS